MKFLAALLLVSSAAQAADIQPGEWEMTVVTQIEGMPQAIGPIVKKQCITAEDAREPSRVLSPSAGSCEFSNRRDDGSFYQFDISCGGQIAMRGSGSVRYGAQSMDTDLDLAAEVGGKKVGTRTRMAGRRLGPCTP